MVWSRSLFSHPLGTSRWRLPYLLSLGSRGMGPRSLLREVLGELTHSPWGPAQQGLWICFGCCLKKKRKRKYIFLKKGLPRVLSLLGWGSYLIVVLI